MITLYIMPIEIFVCACRIVPRLVAKRILVLMSLLSKYEEYILYYLNICKMRE